MLTPTIADSEIGVSMTRASPTSAASPCLTPSAPPYGPTSSPSTKTLGSRRISSASASRIASRYDSSLLGIKVRDRIVGLWFRRRHRELHRFVDLLDDPRLDLPQLV